LVGKFVFDIIFSVYQPRQVSVLNQRLEVHLGHHHQGLMCQWKRSLLQTTKPVSQRLVLVQSPVWAPDQIFAFSDFYIVKSWSPESRIYTLTLDWWEGLVFYLRLSLLGHWCVSRLLNHFYDGAPSVAQVILLGRDYWPGDHDWHWTDNSLKFGGLIRVIGLTPLGLGLELEW